MMQDLLRENFCPKVRRKARLATTVEALVLVGLVGTVACSDLSKTAFPAGVSDPNTYHTASGALQLYNGAVYSFTGGAGTSSPTGVTSSLNPKQGAFSTFVLESGLFTDELQAGNLGGTPADYTVAFTITSIDSLDGRVFAPVSADMYSYLQNVRGATAQAIGALATYAPTTSPALRGHLYTLEGYAELALADFFCSGVPLSTVNFNADYTYQPGSTTIQVYQHALALLDTAITLSADSVRILTLARIGKGRALLALGRYAEAAQAVTSVPTTYQYTFYVNWGIGTNSLCTLFECPGFGGQSTGMTVADGDGGNGLPYITSGDPRSLTEQYKVNQFGVPQYAPQKYGVTAPALAPLVLASGVEARLIEAEAALHANPSDPTWLTILNMLRTTCTDAGSCPSPAPAGTGGMPGLPPLSDPGAIGGSDTARVTLLFTERAYWLFLTGERQGDLRRLVRNYGRDPETVYPTGPYPLGQQFPRYSRAVSENIPQAEFANPKFTGCLSQGA